MVQNEECAVDEHFLILSGLAGIVGFLLKVAEKTKLPISTVEPKQAGFGVEFGFRH